MATKIVTKNSSTASAAPSASDLVQGELAVNVTDKRLYTENASGAIVELGTSPSTIDINAGTIDGTVIGGATPAAISGTTGQFGTSLNVDGTATMDGLTVDSGTGNTVANFSSTDIGAYINLSDQYQTARFNATGSVFKIEADPDNAYASTALAFTTDGTERFRIASDGSLSTPTLGTSNVRFGVNAGNSIASGGNYNVVVGDEAGTAITTGDYNTALGYGSLQSTNTGEQNTAVGRLALRDNTTGTLNVAMGVNALLVSETGHRNIAIGTQALTANTTADNNTAVGHQALLANTTGTNNVALGANALAANTSASNNVALGASAGYSNATGTSNVFLGNGAGYSTTGSGNTFVGGSTSGAYYPAGYLVTSGANNTIIGGYNGNEGGLDIRTSSNNIVLSDGDGNPRGYYKGGDTWHFVSPTDNQNSMFIDNTGGSYPYGPAIRLTAADPNNTTQYFLKGEGNGTNRLFIYSNGNITNTNNSYGAISDVKLKENIIDASSQWDDIKALTVRKYSLKADNLDAPNMLGVIAQEVEEAGMGGLVYESPDMDSEHNDLGTVTKQVNYSILYMKAVKALQEAMDRIESLETRITTLEG